MDKPKSKSISQTFVENGGRIFRERRGRRVVTVAYRQDDGGTVRYGATIFRKENKSDNYVRKTNNAFAIRRCLENPVVLSVDPDLDTYHLHKTLRHALTERGVESKG